MIQPITSDNSALIKSIFLLMLAVSGNFVGETMGCKEQYYMSNNMYVKHGIILMMIYFTLNFTANKLPHPASALKTTLLIWISFLLFNKMNVGFTMLIILILIIFYLISNFVDYRQQEHNILPEKQRQQQNAEFIASQDHLAHIQTYLIYVMIAIVAVGFVKYVGKKRQDYGKKFSLTKFIFGVTKCRNSLT